MKRAAIEKFHAHTMREIMALSPRAAPKAPLPTEYQEQAAVVSWWRSYAATKGIDERLLMASAGGAVLAGDAKNRAIQMARLKASGYRVGTPDLMLAVPKRSKVLKLTGDWGGEYAVTLFDGLFIELKREKGGKTSPKQLEMAPLLRQAGYNCVIAQGFDEAKRAIVGYLEA